MKWVTVFQAFNPAEAQLVRSRLEAADFAVNVVHELSSLSTEGYSMATGGILVQVLDDEASNARELLASRDPSGS